MFVLLCMGLVTLVVEVGLALIGIGLVIWLAKYVCFVFEFDSPPWWLKYCNFEPCSD